MNKKIEKEQFYMKKQGVLGYNNSGRGQKVGTCPSVPEIHDVRLSVVEVNGINEISS